ncbi:hypothetical protein JAAARDRAFT_122624 [Jaapia argillacea MUCL 33604]|uniref:GST C-terminal domain-containing protein n=1 Tax=Jaapia argillacea MUCL 33604 TaxID=933084 RepID=A0A067Q5C6_9AGAM|nr:hypothetical protein JAAARDRAFT_122624 [Jaapia argillacea MUCL 33604]
MSSSSSPKYTLHYWPGLPGRGEYVRLAFEATDTPYVDDTDVKNIMPLTSGGVASPPHFAVPILEIPASSGSKRIKTQASQSAPEGAINSAYISQTSAILAYLAPKLGLAGDVDGEGEEEREIRRAHIDQLVLTSMDLCSEAHDTHHPIASSLYYEDQLQESKHRAQIFRAERVPKFMKHFNTVLSSNIAKSHRLVGSTTTTADLAFFQSLEGIKFAFPRLLKAMETSGTYPEVFEFHKSLASEEKLSAYLGSDRRRKFTNGIFRHYPELDGES